MALVCGTQFNGIGETCGKTPLVTIAQSLIFTLPNFSFATTADFSDKTKWLEGIAAGNILPVPEVLEQEGQDVEDSIYESTSGTKVLNFEGKGGMMYKVLLPFAQHKILRSYSQKNLKVFLVDMNNRVIGVSNDGTTVEGFSLSYLNVSKQKMPTPDSPAFTEITLQYKDISEWDENRVVIKPTWLASGLTGVLKVDVTVSTVSTFVFTASVAYVDASMLTSAGASTSIPISGLEADSFRIIDQSGNVLDPDANPTPEFTVLEDVDNPGDYIITTVSLTSGSSQVVATTDNLYKSEVETLTATT
jgi:hypothetical protein